MKRLFVFLGMSIILVFLLKGFLYRSTVHYDEVGERGLITLTDAKLIAEIQKEVAGKDLNFDEIVEISSKITNENLKFTIDKASSDPNELIKTGKANCVGYSALFNSIANHIIIHQSKDNIKAKHLVGKLDFLGVDIHQFFKSSFFKDHDFNSIENIETGEAIYIDPTVSDYLWINEVSLKK